MDTALPLIIQYGTYPDPSTSSSDFPALFCPFMHAQFDCHSFSRQLLLHPTLIRHPSHILQILHRPALRRLPLYPRNILFRNRVPRTHVLFHARREARLFAFGERGSGLGNAALEAVFVELLDEHAGVLHRGFLLHLAHDLGFPRVS